MKGLVIVALVLAPTPAFTQDTLKADWKAATKELKTTATLQVVVNAQLRRGSAIHDQAFDALRKLECNYVRFCPWFPYPRLGVAELDAPTALKTSWDFSLLDPLVEDFVKATNGRPVVMTFSTTPQWMWKSDWYSGAPANPDTEEWAYNAGTELKDPSGRQLGEYFRRVFQWYTQGGFTDENGKKFFSSHYYKFPYWEVLNEPEVEHYINPTLYNTIYDATALEIKRVSPQMKFVGASLMRIKESTPDFMETFLDPKKHLSGVPLDYVSYHAYVWINQKRGVEAEQYSSFEQARQFVEQFYFIDAIRKRLSPTTKTMINEVGTIRHEDAQSGDIAPWYWSLSAGVFAYLYSELADMGADVIGESQLVGYPNQFPCVTMIDWKSGEPNLRYWVLKLIKDHLQPGGKISSWSAGSDTQGDYYARAYTDSKGAKKMLLVNMRNKPLQLVLPGSRSMDFIDGHVSGIQKKEILKSEIHLDPFGVAIILVQ